MPFIAPISATTVNSVNNAVTTVNGVAGAVNSYVGTVDDALSAIGLGGVVSGTVGAVLSNGMNLSCWGASLTPQKAKDFINNTVSPYITQLFNDFNASVDKVSGLNKLMKAIYPMWYYFDTIKIKTANWSSCAKIAINDVYKPFFNQIKNQVDAIYNDYKSQGSATSTFTMKPITWTIPSPFYNGKEYVQQNIPTSYSVDIPQITSMPHTGGVTSPENTTIPDADYTTLFGPKNPTTDDNEDISDAPNDENKGGLSLLQIAIGLFGISRLL